MDQIAPLADAGLHGAFRAVRQRTESLAAALSAEDQTVQSMPDASPAKWHRAHTTWFWEQFVLRPHLPDYRSYDDDFHFLFNSYYVSLGERHPRPFRGLVTRPGVEEVAAYRGAVDAAMATLLDAPMAELGPLLRLGLAHEEQHQELLLTDALHLFAHNPLSWADRDGRPPFAVLPGWREPFENGGGAERRTVEHGGGPVAIGCRAADGFAFDNEGPRHTVTLAPVALDRHLVTNGEWLGFIDDGGYQRPELWMSDGWAACRADEWDAPLYWRRHGDGWRQLGPGGAVALDPRCPVRHVSWYEADAYARWAGARLPTEFELEALSPSLPGFDGFVWQWTNSAYLPYPGFRADAGAIGEYNGKFMINQMVLRGGSFATAPGHSRASYRNFFPPDKRWQVTGLRLAYDR